MTILDNGQGTESSLGIRKDRRRTSFWVVPVLRHGIDGTSFYVRLP